MRSPWDIQTGMDGGRPSKMPERRGASDAPYVSW